jgi:hypothetical protein
VDVNLYVLETLARDRLAELHAGAALRGQLRAAPVDGLRQRLGRALIRAGTWALGQDRSPLATRAS